MKKSILLLAALMPFVMFSCEKEKAEKGNGDIIGSDGKYLVKKMTMKGTIEYNGDGIDYEKYTSSQKVDATLKFSYTEGKMSRLEASGTYGVWQDFVEYYGGKRYEEDNWKGNGNIKFTYKDNRVAAEITAQGRVWETYIEEGDNENNETWEEQGSLSGTYTLSMDDGIAISGSGTFKSGAGRGSYTTDKIKFGYDDAGQLTRVYYEGEDEDRTEFKWENGNIVNIGWYYDDDYYYKKGSKSIIRSLFDKKKTKAAKSGSVEWANWLRVEYSNQENKSNIDFARLIFTYLGGYAESGIGVFGFLGKECKNLPSKLYIDDELFFSCEYEFNGNEAVTQIKLVAGDYFGDPETAKATINIEY